MIGILVLTRSFFNVAVGNDHVSYWLSENQILELKSFLSSEVVLLGSPNERDENLSFKKELKIFKK